MPPFRKPAMLALLFSTAALPGCTTYLTTRADPGTAEPTYGTPYRLPMRQFTIAMTWQLAGCTVAGDDVSVKTDPTAEVTSELAEGEALVLDYQHMTNRFKTGTLKVEYWEVGEEKAKRQTRFVHTINAKIAGQEAEAVKAGIKALGSLAGVALKVAGVSAAGTSEAAPSEPDLTCDTNLKRKVDELAGYTKRMEEIGKRLDQIAGDLVVLQGRVIANKLGEKDEAEFNALTNEGNALDKEKKTLVESMAKLKKLLSYTEKFVFADFTFDASGALASRVLDPSPAFYEFLSRALIADNSRCDRNKPDCANPETWLRTNLRIRMRQQQKLTATLTLKDTAATAFADVPRPKTPEELRRAAFAGFVYREPVRAHFQLIQTSFTEQNVRETKMIAEFDDTIPQFGRIRVLPIRSRWGETNELSAEFALDGAPKKINYEAIEAGGTKMIEAAQGGIEEIGKVADTVIAYREAKKKEEEGAQLQDIKDQIELLTEQQKLAKLQTQPSAEQAERDAELARLRYEKERAELLDAIRRAGQD